MPLVLHQSDPPQSTGPIEVELKDHAATDVRLLAEVDAVISRLKTRVPAAHAAMDALLSRLRTPIEA